MAESRILVFSLGKQRYAMDLAYVNGIEEKYDVSPVPASSKNLSGVIHLRNKVIPIYDIKRKFQIYLEDEPKVKKMIITESQGYEIGIEVEDVVGIYDVADKDVKDMPRVARNEDNKCLEKIICIDTPAKKDDVIMVLSVEKILTENEIKDITEVVKDKE